MVLLDTNVISELMKKNCNKNVQSWLNISPAHQVYTSAISKAEIEYGVSVLPDGKKKMVFPVKNFSCFVFLF